MRNWISILVLGAVVVILCEAQPRFASSSQSQEQLWAAAQCGDTAGIERALAAGARVDARDPMDNTALIIASCANRPEAALLLVRRGTEVNVCSNGYGTPLSAAVRHGQVQLVEALLGAGADPNFVEGNGMTAMQAAVTLENRQVIELLTSASSKGNGAAQVRRRS